jgi:hypothetical protein
MLVVVVQGVFITGMCVVTLLPYLVWYHDTHALAGRACQFVVLVLGRRIVHVPPPDSFGLPTSVFDASQRFTRGL